MERLPAWLPDRAERSSRVQTRRARRATSTPPTVMEAMKNAPCLGSRHCMAPVSMLTAPASSLATIRAFAVAAPVAPAWRFESRSPVASLPATVAKPVHFTDPSGQYASGHCCSGYALPFAFARENAWAARTSPRGQGTPQLTAHVVSGGAPSIQLISTEPAPPTG